MFDGRLENEKCHLGRGFNPRYWSSQWDINDFGVDAAVSQQGNRAIIVVRNRPAVHPGVQGLVRLGHRQQQPQRERKSRRRNV